MRSCEFCGTELPEDAKFCGICGRVSETPLSTARGNGGYSPSKESIPASANNVHVPGSQKRSTRRPYQYTPSTPQQYQNWQQVEEPTVKYTPRTPVSSPAQQAAYTPPTATARSNPQQYPYPQAQPPLYVGGFGPGQGQRANLPRPRRRRMGCLISLGVVLLLLIILFSIAIPTAQKVMAFGSAISTQSPLSSQTNFMGTSDRVNILMMGYGGSGHDGAYLTDSMVVMSLMPQSHHTTLISVPRDLWIQYPPTSGNYDKINAVYPIASNNNANPVAGGDAAAQKVSLVTGLNIKYWMTINFTGFRDFINAIGGVDVNVPDAFTSNYPKNDDPSIDASWTKVHFAKGLQHMNGATAIEYARARYVIDNPAEGTDFARSARQQLIMKAALSRLKDWHTWPSFFSAMDALKNTIYSNLSLADLASFAMKMDLNNAHRVGLNFSNVLVGARSNDGQSILLPRNDDWQAIKDYISQQLYN
jgi:polyisoprenyl-teichoic acid--peptidoglycan teichoic acid transferase